MADPRSPDPRYPVDPSPSHPDAPFTEPDIPYSDPAADPLIATPAAIPARSGLGSWIAAGVVAALVVIAVLAFSSSPGTDSATTAVIPDQTGDAVPTPNASPPIPAPGAASEPASPAAQPPAAN